MKMRSEMAGALLMLGGVLPVIAAAEYTANRQYQLIEEFGAENARINHTHH